MDYRLPLGEFKLRLGERIDVDSIGATHIEDLDLPVQWGFVPGVYRAEAIVKRVSLLLEAVCIKLGAEDAAKPLLDNLAASLATSGRESTLPLATLPLPQSGQSKSELLAQAEIIGAGLVAYAREAFAARTRSSATLAQLKLRSRCEQHLWTPDVVDVLMGPRGSTEAMQLFNEYLHQLILLRDALLPFANWREVPIDTGTNGLRFIEQARTTFLTQVMFQGLKHKDLVAFAQHLLGVGLERSGYGFQYRWGIVLPAMIGGSLQSASGTLLRWHPAKFTLNGLEREHFVFEYAYENYEDAGRSYIEKGKATSLGSTFPKEAEIAPVATEDDRRLLSLRLTNASSAYVTDVGQIARAYRYMYRPTINTVDKEEKSTLDRSAWTEYSAEDILAVEELAAFRDDGIHDISANGNPLVLLALLGKLYPQNLIFLEDGKVNGAALRAGKQFGAKVLLSCERFK
ncbi:hypothetical protein [Aureibacillus halotolerans]|uniref:Uncharacterized protein n=1 Tax=Aureibacillus halotolerans TaxID=1508390 RepID=A0A4V3D549_9BACI|nr:hypothetical protein [Aureibacillus halotolerans]TDQ38387.1 hypothetical protein EV213_110134 [Aureibacillus halotolerans]